MKAIDQTYRLIATAPNVGDVITLLKAVTDQVSDIRNPVLKTSVSIETREAVVVVLTSVVDRLRSIGNNGVQRSEEEGNLDD